MIDVLDECRSHVGGGRRGDISREEGVDGAEKREIGKR